MSEQINLTHLLGSCLTSPAWVDSISYSGPRIYKVSVKGAHVGPLPLPEGALDLLCFDFTPLGSIFSNLKALLLALGLLALPQFIHTSLVCLIWCL